MEGNAGSFLVEMREAAYILREATPHGLALIDELVGNANVFCLFASDIVVSPRDDTGSVIQPLQQV